MQPSSNFASQFRAQPEYPPLLRTLDGEVIETAEAWSQLKRPELLELIQRCEYGFLAPPPGQLCAQILYENKAAYGGKAWLREIELTWGVPDFSIHLLLVTPTGKKNCPVFAGVNFRGNHSLVPDEAIRLPDEGMSSPDGGADNRVKATARNHAANVWQIEANIDRGFGVATFHTADLIVDQADLALPRLAAFRDLHCPNVAKDEACATIAVWAWGLQRVLDYLLTDPTVDGRRVAAVGHSRLGKTALLAAATDPRFALVIPSQAGCGGTAPARIGDFPEDTQVETVEIINRAFPHWFCENFKTFGPEPERLPFDQDALLALCAPRPIMLSNASEDHWCHPVGGFRVAQSANSVYQLLRAGGLEITSMPAVHEYSLGKIGYFLREGQHAMGPEEWRVWWAFSERWL